MRILVLDNDETTRQIIECYTQIEKNWDFTFWDKKSGNFDTLEPDMVIVDFADAYYNKLLDAYLERNPQTRTIIISDKLHNSELKGCEFCTAHRNKKRLIKPLEAKKLYDLIKDFDKVKCEFYNVFENLGSILSTIVKRFPSLNYDITTKRVYINEKSLSNRHTYEFVSMLNILEQNQIEYHLLDEYQIQIK